ncbi:hypothetical protein [Peptoniphilus asaccharolyticus]|nr:hypothetical protein [Peptoniphilus asaccharolyticus]
MKPILKKKKNIFNKEEQFIYKLTFIQHFSKEGIEYFVSPVDLEVAND